MSTQDELSATNFLHGSRFGVSIEMLKHTIIERILQAVPSLVVSSEFWTYEGRQCSPGADNPGHGSSKGKGKETEKRTTNKRNTSERDSQEDREDENDDEDESSKRRKAQDNTGANVSIRPKYACPYFKRNPMRHTSNNACSGPGWDSISRLKSVQSCRIINYANICAESTFTDVTHFLYRAIDVRAHSRLSRNAEHTSELRLHARFATWNHLKASTRAKSRD